MHSSRAGASASSAFKSAQSTRFSLLLLEDGEYFLDVRACMSMCEFQLTTARVSLYAMSHGCVTFLLLVCRISASSGTWSPW